MVSIVRFYCTSTGSIGGLNCEVRPYLVSWVYIHHNILENEFISSSLSNMFLLTLAMIISDYWWHVFIINDTCLAVCH